MTMGSRKLKSLQAGIRQEAQKRAKELYDVDIPIRHIKNHENKILNKEYEPIGVFYGAVNEENNAKSYRVLVPIRYAGKTLLTVCDFKIRRIIDYIKSTDEWYGNLN